LVRRRRSSRLDMCTCRRPDPCKLPCTADPCRSRHGRCVGRLTSRPCKCRGGPGHRKTCTGRCRRYRSSSRLGNKTSRPGIHRQRSGKAAPACSCRYWCHRTCRHSDPDRLDSSRPRRRQPSRPGMRSRSRCAGRTLHTGWLWCRIGPRPRRLVHRRHVLLDQGWQHNARSARTAHTGRWRRRRLGFLTVRCSRCHQSISRIGCPDTEEHSANNRCQCGMYRARPPAARPGRHPLLARLGRCLLLARRGKR